MKIIFKTLPIELKNYFSLNTDYFINGYSSFGIAILKDDNFNDFYFCIDTYKEFINLI